MIKRAISGIILQRAKKMPVISVTGPRQSGKTTLVKELFGGYRYVTMENFRERENAQADPLEFLKRKGPGLIIDEAQHVPELFSALQVVTDESRRMGEYILTGSQHFLLLEKISQSLAGRVALFNLLPFSIQELKNAGKLHYDYNEYLWKGFYPALYDRKLDPKEWYPEYIETYVERDLRQLIRVSDLSAFRKFMRLCAGHIGQTVNFSSIASQTGASYQTVKKWLSILETSFVVYFLQPHHVNFNKRIVKSPKLYFYDTGLACSLLGLTEPEYLHSYYQKGALFENMVISEIRKSYYNQGLRPPVFFWRNNSGNEVDLIIEKGQERIPVEIKSSARLNEEFFSGLDYYNSLSGDKKNTGTLVYGGSENVKRQQRNAVSWSMLDEFVSGTI